MLRLIYASLFSVYAQRRGLAQAGFSNKNPNLLFNILPHHFPSIL